MRRWSDDLPLIAVLIIFIIDLTLIVMTHLRWEHTVDRYFPVQQEMTLLRNDISEAHLWFEEIIGGDSDVDIEKDVMIPFTHQRFKAFAKKVHLLLPGDDYEEDVEAIKEVDSVLDGIYVMAHDRWKNTTRRGIGGQLDQEFDDHFKQLLVKIDTVIHNTQKRLSTEIESRDRFFHWIVVLFLSVNAFVFIILYLFKERKQSVERALAREKEQLMVTMRSIGDAVITTDTDGRVTFLNIVAEKLTGYSDAEAVGRPLLGVFNIINDKTGDPAIDPVSRVLKDGKIVGLANHTVLIAKDSTRRQIADSAAPIKDDEGDIIGVVLVFRDVTEEYAMQEQLKREQERLEQAINGTQIGLWDWDLQTDKVYYAPRWKSMLGYKDDEIVDVLQSWSDLVHPDDIEQARHDIQKSHQDPGSLYENIHRLRHKDGHWVWILDRGQTIFDDEGKAVRMVGFHTDISAQKRAEEALVLSNYRYQMLFNESPVPLWEEDYTALHQYLGELREEGIDDLRTYFDEHPEAVMNCLEKIQVEDVNQAALDLHNAKSKEQLLGELDKTFVDNSMAVFKEEMIAIAEGEKAFSSEAEVKTLDGEALTVFLRLRMTVDRNGRLKALLATTDITKRRAVEMALESSEEKMRSIFRAAPIGIGLVSNRMIQEVNKLFCEMTGYGKEELIGKSARMLYLSDEDYAYVGGEKYRQIQEHGTGTVQTRLRRKDGEVIDVLLSSTPIDMADLSVGVTFTALDISQQVKDAKELKEQEEMMLAQSRHAAMGEMISMIAHQWRQPLSVISMSVNNLLADIELDELDVMEVQRQSHTVLRQTQQLSHTIDDFRNFFRPNKEKEKLTIASIMDDTQKVIGPGLRSNSVRLEVQNESDTALFIHRRELIQVFLSLINNAKDAVMAHAEGEKRILITISESVTTIDTAICDNGGGVDKSIMNKVFEPYFTTKMQQTGTGLGLYMSKTIVEQHLDGHISVENRGEGACFTVSLPKE